MATEIFMSCTCTSVVRGTANGLLFLPSPHLSAEAFQEIPPPGPGEVQHGPLGAQLSPGTSRERLLPWAGPTFPLPPPLPLCPRCPVMSDWTRSAAAVRLMLCSPIRPCPGQGQACGPLVPVFP